MIQLFHVSKIFGPTVALKDIDLRIRTGEFVFVTGPSGAGKTTLLRLIFGAEPPTEGQIVNILKEAEAGVSLEDLIRQHGFSKASFYKWKAKYSGMSVSELKRLRELEEENRRLKKMYAESQMSADILKEALTKKW